MLIMLRLAAHTDDVPVFSSPAFSINVFFMVPRFHFPRFQRPHGDGKGAVIVKKSSDRGKPVCQHQAGTHYSLQRELGLQDDHFHGVSSNLPDYYRPFKNQPALLFS